MAEEVKDIGIGYSAWDETQPRKEVGIGLIGRGFMGKAHSNAFKKVGYLFETNYIPKLVGISATTMERAQSAADRYGYEKAYVGWEEMIKNPDIDIIDNVAIDKVHPQPCIDAAKAGKAVLCEKPMAIGREEAKRMLDAVNKYGVKNMVCFNYRFLPAVRLAWDLIQKGAIGEIVHFYGRYHQEYALPLDAPVEDVWYQNMSGNTQDLASHIFDQAQFLVGEVSTIMGDIRSYPKRRPTRAGGMVDVKLDDGMRALLEFKNGATGTLEGISAAHGRKNQLYWEVYGTKGTLVFDLENPSFLKVDLKETVLPEVMGFTNVAVNDPMHPFMSAWWPKGHNIGWEHGHINLAAHLLDCVANDKEVGPQGATFEDGYKVAVMIDTLIESSQAEKKVEISY
jgi:predicted dehydrogenase